MRFEEAEAIYRRVLESDPKSIAAYLELGIVLERGNRLDRLADLLMMVDTDGVAAKDLTYLRALSMRREGKLTEALALAQEAPAHIEPARRAGLIGRLADSMDAADTEIGRAPCRDRGCQYV